MNNKNTLQTPPQIPIVDVENKTPDQTTPYNSEKIGTPDRLKVPKAFKYPERYTSPNDKMMSPVTRGILARSKKGSKVFPPSAANQPKIQEVGLLQVDTCWN